VKVLPQVMGGENEYALAAQDARGRPVSQDDLAAMVVHRLADDQPTLVDCSGGVFLANGARCYVDCGQHPEYSTPECTDPRDVVRHIKAGERLLCAAAKQVEQNACGVQLSLFRTNVDHSGSGATWGAHESYMHGTHVNTQALVRNLLPHLISRVIYTGAGGFDPTSRGLRFMLSPRALFFEQAVSSASTENRGIFHTKDESLASPGLQRLHVLCGESLGSATSAVLKFGTTALVVRLIDQGFHLGIWLEPKDPVDAYHQVARDITLGKPIELLDGGRMTALQMQQHYLREVSRRLGEPYMPGWAEAVCRLWSDTLAALEQGLEAVVTRLDWAMRYALFMDRAERVGLDWSRVALWTETLDEVTLTARMDDAPPTDERDLVAQLVGLRRHARLPGWPSREWQEADEALSGREGRVFLQQRNALLEVDLRFGQLGDEGLLSVLERSGHLAHDVGGVDRITEAMSLPPTDTRAQLRGSLIRRLSSQAQGPLICGWDAIWNRGTGKVLDLSSPFENEERWRRMTPQEERAFRYRGGGVRGAAAGA
jgi:proteasome accessory factor A